MLQFKLFSFPGSRSWVRLLVIFALGTHYFVLAGTLHATTLVPTIDQFAKSSSVLLNDSADGVIAAIQSNTDAASARLDRMQLTTTITTQVRGSEDSVVEHFLTEVWNKALFCERETISGPKNSRNSSDKSRYLIAPKFSGRYDEGSSLLFVAERLQSESLYLASSELALANSLIPRADALLFCDRLVNRPRSVLDALESARNRSVQYSLSRDTGSEMLQLLIFYPPPFDKQINERWVILREVFPVVLNFETFSREGNPLISKTVQNLNVPENTSATHFDKFLFPSNTKFIFKNFDGDPSALPGMTRVVEIIKNAYLGENQPKLSDDFDWRRLQPSDGSVASIYTTPDNVRFATVKNSVLILDETPEGVKYEDMKQRVSSQFSDVVIQRRNLIAVVLLTVGALVLLVWILAVRFKPLNYNR